MKPKHISYDQFVTGVEGLKIAVYSERYYQTFPHIHDEYEIIFIKRGSLLVEINNSRFYAKEGSTYFVQKSTPHGIMVDENTTPRNEFHYYITTFNASMIGCEDDLARKLFDRIKVDTNITLSDESKSLFPNMRKWDIEKPSGYEMYLKNGLIQILAELIATEQYVKLDTYESKSSKHIISINSVTKYIDSHYQEDISVSVLSQISGYSESHMYRVFKEQTGMSITEYISKRRVDQACIELLYTEKNITQIAISCGFTYIQNFSRTFAKYMGISPMQYRKRAIGFKKISVPD